MRTKRCLALLVMLLVTFPQVSGAVGGGLAARTQAAVLSGELPGPSPADPTQLLPGEPQSFGLIPEGGEDWFTINVTPGFVHTVELVITGDFPELSLSLCDEAGNDLYMVATDEEAGNDTLMLVWLAEQPDYSVRVQYAESVAPTTYDISFDRVPDEANSALDDAVCMEVYGTPLYGSMNEQHDVDWFRIPLQPGRYYYVQMYHAASMGVLVDLLDADGTLLMSGQRMSSGAWLCFHPPELSEVFLRLSHVPGTSLGMYDTLLCYDYPDVVDVTCDELVQGEDTASVTVTVRASEAARSSSEEDRRYLDIQLNRPSGQPWMGEMQYSVSGGGPQAVSTDSNGRITIPADGWVWGDDSPALGSGQQITIAAPLEPGDYTLNVITTDRFVYPIDMVSQPLHVSSPAEVAVQAAMDAIAVLAEPAELTLDDKPAVLAARQLVAAAFELGAGELEIANLSKLVMAESRIAQLEHPPTVEEPVEDEAPAPLQQMTTHHADGSPLVIYTVTGAARTLIAQARRAGQTAVEFAVDASDLRPARRVVIPGRLLQEVTGLGVVIRCGGCVLEFPASLVQQLAQDEQGITVDLAAGDESMLGPALDGTFQPVAQPLQIDTVLQGDITVTLHFPIDLPAEPEARQALLDNLAMLAVHATDAELIRELNFIFADNGNSLIAASFQVQRFSAFCLVKLDPIAVAAQQAVGAIDELPLPGELAEHHAVLLETARAAVNDALKLGAAEAAMPNLASLTELERRMEQLLAAQGVLRVGLQGNSYTLNGEAHLFDAATAISMGEGVTGVAPRLLEGLGVKVTYRAVGQHGEIQIAFLGTVLTLWDGSDQMVISGKLREEHVTMSAAVRNRNGRCYIPLRDVCRYLGLRVDWHAGEQSITVSGR